MFGFASEVLSRVLRRDAIASVLQSYPSIAVLGDSITVGVNASDAAHRWANLVAGMTGATLLNAGISGTVLQNSKMASGAPQTNNGRDRFTADVLGANRKAAIFIAYGFNDARYIGAPATFNVAQYQKCYQELVNGLILGGYAPGDIHIGSPYYITDTGLTSYGSDPNFAGQTRSGFEAFVAAAEAVATEFGTRYCNLYAFLRDNGFAATIDTDNIHPLNAGMALIALCWQTRTYLPNRRAAPASAGITGASGSATVTAGTVSGAASYDYALVLNAVNVATNSTGSFTGLTAPGDYYGKARAVFADGGKGPWCFSPSAVTVAGITGVFVSDSFTGTTGALLTGHTPETGGAWKSQPGETATSEGKISSAGRLYCSTSAGAALVFQNQSVPGKADYYVEADLVFLSNVTNMSAGVAGRMQTAADTFYWARYSHASAAWQLYRTVNNTSTQIGGNVATPAFAAGQTRKLRLTMVGTTISVQVDGTTIITQSDANISAAGYAGTRGLTAIADTTGIHLDNFKAETL